MSEYSTDRLEMTTGKHQLLLVGSCAIILLNQVKESAVYKSVAFAAVVVLVMLVGCNSPQPQIVDPFNSGFTDNEYIVIEVQDKDRIGQLYEAVVEVDEKGRQLPLRWRSTSLLIFPQGPDFNNLVETKFEQTRNVVETIRGSGRLTVSAVADLNASSESAFKYQSRSTSVDRLQMPLKYNEVAKRYMRLKLEQSENYRFSYLSALYKGAAFVELLNKAEKNGVVTYAAFKINGEYYTSSNRGLVTSGAVIFQLQPVYLDELIDASIKSPVVPKGTYAPMTRGETQKSIDLLPVQYRQMIDGSF